MMGRINYLDLLNFQNNDRHKRIASEAIKILCLSKISYKPENEQTDLEKFGSTLGEYMNLFEKFDKHPKELTAFIDFTLPKNQVVLNEFLVEHNITMLQFFTFYSYLKHHHFKIDTSKNFSLTDDNFFDHLEITANQYTALCISIPSKLFSLSFWGNLEAPENAKAKEFIVSIINFPSYDEKENQKKLKQLQKRFIALLKGENFSYKNID